MLSPKGFDIAGFGMEGSRSVAVMDLAHAENEEGVRHLRAGNPSEARRWFLKALGHAPRSPEVRAHLGQSLLASGHYELGWLLYEARRLALNGTKDPGLDIPEWRGEDVSGKRVAVILEQGFGDQIMFARFLPLLAERGAIVTYCCSPELAPLFPNAAPPRRSLISTAADYWVFVGSLPHRLGVATVPPPVSIPIRTGSGGGVGVMPHTGAVFTLDAERRLPEPTKARLLELGRDLSPSATGARDFRDTAEIIADLDLVISADTAVVHLAASMGKPVWVLVTPASADWRWPHYSRCSPWYPSVRLYWLKSEWTSLVDEVERDLGGAQIRQ